MTRVRSATAPAVFGALAVLGAGVAVLSRSSSVLVHQCVADGTAGAIGLRLALLRHDPACPSELAVGGDTRQVIGVVVLVAAPVLALHLAGLLAGLGLLARANAGLRAVAAVLAGLVARPEAAQVPGPSGALPAPVAVLGGPRTAALLGAPLRRGPPLALV